MASVTSNPPACRSRETRLKGLLERRPCWRLSPRGWTVVALAALVSAAIFIRCVHPFLAVNAPVDAKVLVVEGWVEDYAIKDAVREFNEHDYQHVYVTGTPIERGAPLSEYKTYAALGAAALKHLGIPTNRLQSVPAPDVQRDRTYASALAEQP